MNGIVQSGLALLAVTAAISTATAAPPAMTTQATLLDRVQIEDLIVSYYYNLGQGDAEAFGDYYTEDATFDVNGIVARGRAGIAGIYRQLAGAGPGQGGTFHMLLSNPMIRVSGDAATAEFLWTGITNDTPKAPPRFVEQGREYDTLVKQNGAWRIRKRVVIADSGLPAIFDKTYTPRRNYDPGRE